MAEIASILVVEDDVETRRLIHRTLSRANYSVSSVGVGREVIQMARKALYDLVIVDLILPDTDGLDLTRNIKAKSPASVIILSGLGDTVDKIVGLEAGADDYLTKPFDPRELLARVRSVLRRASRQTSKSDPIIRTYVFDRFQLNLETMTLSELGGEPINLTSGEFALLRVFVENPRRVLTRDQLMDALHGVDTPAYERSIDVRIGRLRKKIEENPSRPSLIKTVRNVGYLFAGKISEG